MIVISGPTHSTVCARVPRAVFTFALTIASISKPYKLVRSPNACKAVSQSPQVSLSSLSAKDYKPHYISMIAVNNGIKPS